MCKSKRLSNQERHTAHTNWDAPHLAVIDSFTTTGCDLRALSASPHHPKASHNGQQIHLNATPGWHTVITMYSSTSMHVKGSAIQCLPKAKQTKEGSACVLLTHYLLGPTRLLFCPFNSIRLCTHLHLTGSDRLSSNCINYPQTFL